MNSRGLIPNPVYTVKLAAVVKGSPKALFSLAKTLRCRGQC